MDKVLVQRRCHCYSCLEISLLEVPALSKTLQAPTASGLSSFLFSSLLDPKMDPSPQTAGQDPFLTDSMQNSSSQYDSPSSSSFNPAIQQSTNEFAQDPQLFSAAQDLSQVETVQPVQTPQRQRMPQSQYYIVFSVTGIERSNAKNPIIRFDAKVLTLGLMLFSIQSY